jgi:hypothetical protein
MIGGVPQIAYTYNFPQRGVFIDPGVFIRARDIFTDGGIL